MGMVKPEFDPYSAITLEDKYTAETGKVFMNGTQALVRLPIVQMRRDRRAGLNTGGFISGYRGSPVGGLDFAFQSARKHLAENDIVFQPGVNEELAATAVWGSQQLNLSPGARKDGIVGMWYGKGPGVDRCGDVFKHANSFGSSKQGGVLAIAGDDHLAKSSTVAHQSDHALMAAIMPIIYPSSVQEFTELGLLGIAMSRYSGLWVGFKVIADTIETTGVVDLAGEQRQFVTPNDFEMPKGGLNIRWPDDRFAQDERLQEYKGYAAIAFARANQLDQWVIDSKKPRFGIVASGKAYENVREALRHLEIDEKTADKIGLRLYKVRMPWPLEPEGIRNFSQGLEEVLVIEERREVIEHQIKQQLFNWRADVRPRIVGKFDHKDRDVLSLYEEITAGVATRIIATRLLDFDLPDSLRQKLEEKLSWYNERRKLKVSHTAPVSRIAHFCSGCPHNTSTKVPDGSRALAGIGCHFMVLWMDRNTQTYTHMGGEGVPWLGQAPFTDEKHVFANLGDGTYFHSGVMAIRAAVASKANITYKLLYNDAVAMTGGQAIDGTLSVPDLAAQLAAEGVTRLWLVSDEPEKYKGAKLPDGISIHHRDYLEAIQKEARETKGCSAIIYDQTCATEKRRRRKRGLMEDPDKRAFINPLICEGCGDCSLQSNCISIEPLETEFGRKRQINQSSCNKDFSCVNGFCPSFVTLEGASLKKRALPKLSDENLPEPNAIELADEVYNIAVTGIGGTGVLTIGAIIGMAAHLEGIAAMMQDFSGLAQKGGAVLSHIRLSKSTDLVAAAQIPPGEADLLMAADTVVAADKGPISLYQKDRTAAILNTHLTPVSSFIFERDFDFRENAVIKSIAKGVRENPEKIDFTKFAEIVCGDTIATNVMMLGYAYQKGLLPIGIRALEKAIELNGVAVKMNLLAFNWGRRIVEKPDETVALLAKNAQQQDAPETLGVLVERRANYLAEYQDEAYANRYRNLVTGVEAVEHELGLGDDLSEAVARNLFKLMAYKDEYEVARLYTDGNFEKRLKDNFDGDLKVTYHLAPPLLGGKKLPNGRPRKRAFGPRIVPLFKLLARMKGLRGGTLDVFGYTQERKQERQLIEDYQSTIESILPKLSAENHRYAVELAHYPDQIRGFGPVKEKAIEKTEKIKAALLAQFENPPAPESLFQNSKREGN